MKSRLYFSLVTFLLPLALVGTACAFKGGEKRTRGTAMFVDSRERGRLGVGVEDVTPKLARLKDLKAEHGVYVSHVEADSPAETAGVKRR